MENVHAERASELETTAPTTLRTPITPVPPALSFPTDPFPKDALTESPSAPNAPDPARRAPNADGPSVMAPNAPVYGAYGPYPGYPGWPAPPYRAVPGWAPPLVQNTKKPTPRAFRPAEIAAAIGIAVTSDVALWHDGVTAGGFGAALFFTAIPLAMFACARAWRGSWRLGVITALLALVALRCVYHPTGLLILSGLGLVLAFGLSLRARRVFVPEALASTMAALGKLPSRLGAATAGVIALTKRTRLGNVSVLPIVIPAGLVALFLGVFALANPVVAHGIGSAWTAIANVVGFPSVGRIFLWAVMLVVGVALLRPTLKLAKGSETKPRTTDATPTALLVARNALVGLNVLFLGYNAIDARYLWTGSPPAGMRTQQYAHEGAFWLTVALLMLTAVIGVMFRGALAHDASARAKTSRTLGYLWIAQGLVLGLATYRRIAIHIAKSGLSDLRIVGILGTSLVVCGVVLVALKLKNEKTFTWLLRRQLDAFAVTALLYTITPTHLISANVNVARVTSGEYRPVLHAFRQSHETESAAAYLPLLDHSDKRVREGIAALLKDEHQRLRNEAKTQTSWRERDIATTRTLAALDAASPRIDAALGSAQPDDARRVLLEISRAANDDVSLEELLAIPGAASDLNEDGGGRRTRVQ